MNWLVWSSFFHSNAERNLICYNKMLKIRQNIPNAITSLRFVALPHLVYSFNHQITLVVYALFLFSIGTDLADGYIARKLNSASKFGSYLDTTVDFLFISGMYLAFIINGIYSPWILLIIASIFLQFIILNVYVKKTIYDPIGKYYGSLLFGGIGLTLLFPDQLVYNIITFGIVISTLASIISRLTYFLRTRK